MQPVGLAYLDAATGQPALAPAYIGDLTLLQCLDAILRAPPITARLCFAPALTATSASRRDLAEAARAVVSHLSQGAQQHAVELAVRVNEGRANEPSFSTAGESADSPAPAA